MVTSREPMKIDKEEKLKKKQTPLRPLPHPPEKRIQQ
jgi:hypothetical protein